MGTSKRKKRIKKIRRLRISLEQVKGEIKSVLDTICSLPDEVERLCGTLDSGFEENPNDSELLRYYDSLIRKKVKLEQKITELVNYIPPHLNIFRDFNHTTR